MQILYPSTLHPTNSAGPSQDPCGRDDEDLAYYENDKSGWGEFFLGCRELGVRLGVSHKTTSEYLLKLAEYEIIQVTSAGRMTKRKASEYKWMLMP